MCQVNSQMPNYRNSTTYRHKLTKANRYTKKTVNQQTIIWSDNRYKLLRQML